MRGKAEGNNALRLTHPAHPGRAFGMYLSLWDGIPTVEQRHVEVRFKSPSDWLFGYTQGPL